MRKKWTHLIQRGHTGGIVATSPAVVRGWWCPACRNHTRFDFVRGRDIERCLCTTLGMEEYRKIKARWLRSYTEPVRKGKR
jgi:hypothetical protein